MCVTVLKVNVPELHGSSYGPLPTKILRWLLQGKRLHLLLHA